MASLADEKPPHANDSKAFPLIVIGASAGGFEAIKKIVSLLPADIHAAILVVWHMSPNIRGILADVLNNVNNIPAAVAMDGEVLLPNHIYVAAPDRHLVVDRNKVRVTKGPKENRFRPAVDPLFRSAAYFYSTRVIGVILSGALDDGTAGLWAIKYFGGIAITQDPMEAEVRSMPESAMREVDVDYCLPVREIADVLTALVQERTVVTKIDIKPDPKTDAEIRIALEANALENEVMKFGEFSPFTCPECHGVLTLLRDGNLSRFRCHTGHAFSPSSLLDALSEGIEESLYNALRSVDESVMLLNHVGDHFAEENKPKIASTYFRKAKEAEKRSKLLRESILKNEHLSDEAIRQQANGNGISD